MTFLDDLREALAPPPAPSPQPMPRSGSLNVPAQTTPTPGPELSAHEPFELTLSPGIPDRPSWPFETWMLKSFQIPISGTLIGQEAIELTRGGESLELTLALKQNGYPVWSQNLALPLLEVPGSKQTEFTFNSAVFVDFQNPVAYQGGGTLTFTVSGVAPAFTPVPEPLDRFEAESIELLAGIKQAIEGGE
jgi:hypothetical protein